MFVGGAAVQWLRDGLGIISDPAEVETLAASVESTIAANTFPVPRDGASTTKAPDDGSATVAVIGGPVEDTSKS